MKKQSLIFYIICLCFFSSTIFASDYHDHNIPDSSEIRKQLGKKWFNQDLKHLRLNESEIHENSMGEKFQVRLEELDDSYAIIVAPHSFIDVDIINAKEKKTVKMDIYPADKAGSWVLFKDKATENPIKVRWYFSVDSNFYLEFVCKINSATKKSKEEQKVYADFVLFDYYLTRSMPVGLTLKQLYSISFIDLVENTSTSIPWKYADIKNYAYGDILQMIGVIQEKMPNIEFVHDACYDGNAEPVKISTGEKRNESAKKGGISVDGFGFAKWVVDGLVRPIAGSNLKLDPLKYPTTKLKTGSKADYLSDKYNVYFALDWTRNLASAYLSVVSGHNYVFEDSGCEVRIQPFATKFTEGGVKNVSVYVQDSGYSAECLKALFYVLAIDEPGKFYLGSVRETDDGEPQNVFYTKAVVFFPYFDENDFFHVCVFKDCKEYTIDEFITKNPEIFVNLVRLQSSQKFFPLPQDAK